MTAAAKRPPLPKMVKRPMHMHGAGTDMLQGEDREAAFDLTHFFPRTWMP